MGCWPSPSRLTTALTWCSARSNAMRTRRIMCAPLSRDPDSISSRWSRRRRARKAVCRCPASWPWQRQKLIAPENHRGEPAGEQRQAGGGEAVQQAVLACGIGDELLEPDLLHFDRRVAGREDDA